MKKSNLPGHDRLTTALLYRKTFKRFAHRHPVRTQKFRNHVGRRIFKFLRCTSNNNKCARHTRRGFFAAQKYAPNPFVRRLSLFRTCTSTVRNINYCGRLAPGISRGHLVVGNDSSRARRDLRVGQKYAFLYSRRTLFSGIRVHTHTHSAVDIYLARKSFENSSHRLLKNVFIITPTSLASGKFKIRDGRPKTNDVISGGCKNFFAQRNRKRPSKSGLQFECLPQVS